MCSVYIAPQNSSRELRISVEYVECLQEKVDKLGTLGKIIKNGDFNSRVGDAILFF